MIRLMKNLALALLLLLFALPAAARDELVTSARTAGGETIPYVLTTKPGTPAYAVILMPGGSGVMNPRMVDGKLVFGFAGNFLIRSRELVADGRFVAASTDATSTPARILAIAQDLERRFGKVAVYVIGTSRSTDATMALAAPLDGQVAGFVGLVAVVQDAHQQAALLVAGRLAGVLAGAGAHSSPGLCLACSSFCAPCTLRVRLGRSTSMT